MIGSQLLHYRLEQRLGAGAMGEVYRARDERLGRDVAIKILPQGREVDEERFQREAQTLASLNHPHIVTLHAIEETDGCRFLVMELVDGEGLDQRIPQMGMPDDELLSLAVPLAEAVSAAHQRGILHRDLKPSNVMLGDEDRLKVLDFGLAQPMRETADDDDITRTEAAAVSGTVPYMAPELLRGQAPDERTDLFSLGVMLFEMATGERPWRGPTPVEVLVSILEDQPQDLRKLSPKTSGQLVAIIERCLEKKPDRRYPSAADLLADLERLRDGRGPMSTTLTSTVMRQLRRRRRGLLSAAAIVSALSLGAAWQASRPVEIEDDGQRTIAVLPFESLGPEAEAYFAVGVTEEIVSRLSGVRGLGIIARSSVEQISNSERPLDEVGRELGIDYVLEGTVRWGAAEDGTSRVRVTPRLIDIDAGQQLWSTSYDRVLADIFGVQTDIAQEVVEALDLKLFPAEQRDLEEPPTENLEAYQAYLAAIELSGDYSDPRSQSEVIRLFERAATLDPEFTDAWAEIGWRHAQIYHFGLDKSANRIEMSQRALERARALDPTAAIVHLAQGYFHYWVEQDHDAALRSLNLAARGLPGDGRIPETEGYVLRRQGRFARALTQLTAARELDPLNSNLHREIGSTLSYLRRFDEAIESYGRAKETTGEPLLAYLYEARVEWLRGDVEAARRVLTAMPDAQDNGLRSWFLFWQAIYEGDARAALAELDEMPEPFIRWTTMAQPVELLRAEAHRLLGDRDAARQAFERSLEAIDEALEVWPDDLRLNASRAVALAGLGRRDEALAEADLVADSVPLELDAVFALDKRLERARVELLLGDVDAARATLEDLLAGPAMLSQAFLRIDPRWRPALPEPPNAGP